MQKGLIENLIQEVRKQKAWRAVKYLSDTKVVRVTQILYNKTPRSWGNQQFTVTLGKPNYKEREFIRLCKIAKEVFPVRKIQLQFPPQRKNNKKRD